MSLPIPAGEVRDGNKASIHKALCDADAAAGGRDKGRGRPGHCCCAAAWGRGQQRPAPAKSVTVPGRTRRQTLAALFNFDALMTG